MRALQCFSGWAMVLAATLASVAGTASAATLFTSTAHTTRVTAGATAGLTLSAPQTLTWTGPTGTDDTGNRVRPTTNYCTDSTLRVSITSNNGSVGATVTGGTFTGCHIAPTYTFPWTIGVSGTSTVVGTERRWPASLGTYGFDLFDSHWSGAFTGTAFEPVSGTAPVCIRLADGGTFGGPVYLGETIDATYCFEGTAAGWSLTN